MSLTEVRAWLATSPDIPPKVLDALHVVLDDARRYKAVANLFWAESPMAVVVNPKVAVKLGHDCPSGERLTEMIDQIVKNEDC